MDRSLENVLRFVKKEPKGHVLEAAQSNFESGAVHVLGFSGKKASGKDTLSEAVASLMERGGEEVEMLAFAAALKAEATAMMGCIHTGLQLKHTEAKIASDLESKWNVPQDQSETLVQAIIGELSAEGGETLTGWNRTQGVLKFVQFLGTEVRQPQNKYYWVGNVMERVVFNCFRGVSSLITDVRFPHEMEPLVDIGAPVVRVDVTREAQIRRLQNRDGLRPSDESLSHPSEMRLDDCDAFSLRVENSTDDRLEEKAALALSTLKVGHGKFHVGKSDTW